MVKVKSDSALAADVRAKVVALNTAVQEAMASGLAVWLTWNAEAGGYVASIKKDL